ncbi:MAG: hypothetical protein JWQ11_1781 [Rhizobacter sp.]|nr:hypothetical protein [Rhizobacter sp.]
MIDHTDDGIRAAIKALDEVVAPALDPANPLALEQLKLVSRFLGFLRSRLPYEHLRSSHELRHYLALARQLVEIAPNEGPVHARDALLGAIHEATPLISDPTCSPVQLEAGTKRLSAALSTLVRDVAEAPPAVRDSVERAVTHAARRLLDAQRAWFLPMGFEPDPARVPSMEEALERY